MIGRYQSTGLSHNYLDTRIEEAEACVQSLENSISNAKKEVSKLRSFVKWLRKKRVERERPN